VKEHKLYNKLLDRILEIESLVSRPFNKDGLALVPILPTPISPIAINTSSCSPSSPLFYKLSELKTINLVYFIFLSCFYFHFILFSFSDLGYG